MVLRRWLSRRTPGARSDCGMVGLRLRMSSAPPPRARGGVVTPGMPPRGASLTRRPARGSSVGTRSTGLGATPWRIRGCVGLLGRRPRRPRGIARCARRPPRRRRAWSRPSRGLSATGSTTSSGSSTSAASTTGAASSAAAGVSWRSSGVASTVSTASATSERLDDVDLGRFLDRAAGSSSSTAVATAGSGAGRSWSWTTRMRSSSASGMTTIWLPTDRPASASSRMNSRGGTPSSSAMW